MTSRRSRTASVPTSSSIAISIRRGYSARRVVDAIAPAAGGNPCPWPSMRAVRFRTEVAIPRLSFCMGIVDSPLDIPVSSVNNV